MSYGGFFLIKIVTYITSNIKIDYTEYELFFSFLFIKVEHCKCTHLTPSNLINLFIFMPNIINRNINLNLKLRR